MLVDKVAKFMVELGAGFSYVGNVLTRKKLEVIQADLAGCDYEKIVVYGEACRLMQPTLQALKMEFRQTPCDLVTRR